MANDRNRPSRSVRELILDAPGNPLAEACHRSLDLLSLQAAIRAELGPPLDEHLFVAPSSPGTLLVFTDSPAWAARLRYLTARILAAANGRAGAGFKTLRIRTHPSLRADPDPGPGPAVPPAASRLLASVAEGIDDPALRAVLLRLSRRK